MSAPRLRYELDTQREPLAPPTPGKNIIVSIVLNVECWPFDQPMPRAILNPPHGAQPVPDVPNFSWAEQGMRLGLPRLVEMIATRGLPAGINLNAAVIDAYPKAAELLLRNGFEFIGHGLSQRILDPADERDVVRESINILAGYSRQRIRGWLGPGLQETFDTPDVLSECGIDYVCDWVVDDQPVWLEAKPRRLVAVPYSLELNDSVIYAIERQPSPEFQRRVVDTLRSYDCQRNRAPFVLTLPLHPHLIGARHRLPYFAAVLDLLIEREDTVFMTGSEICDWFVGQSNSIG
jgi:allantoinase